MWSWSFQVVFVCTKVVGMDAFISFEGSVIEEVFVICGDGDEISSHVSVELVGNDELKGIGKNMAKE